MRYLRPAFLSSLALWVLLGLGFPLVMTGLSQLLLRSQADGSPVYLDGRVVAAKNVGQFFHEPGYFWGRPSATVSLQTGKPDPYNALASGPSNLAPTNRLLLEHIKHRISVLKRANPGVETRQIPLDMVESSGSGLDPDISPQAAYVQVPRVARVTHLSPAFLRTLISTSIQGPQWGLFGASTVNVTLLNLALYQVLHA
jgi:K+-transporting ATPase ATPase C chain